MPITVIVRSPTGDEARLTFDGTQRVVLGRSAGCEVRLPDASVSHRHAILRAQGADFAIVDEGSSNGTWVGGARVAAHTSRLVRSGDMVRLGRMWIELRIEQGPVTRDVAAATRDLALNMLARQLEARGVDLTMRVRVIEGPDQGASLALKEEGRPYVVGRGPQCDLPLADVDASREHAIVVRRGDEVTVRDRGAKNGTWLGGVRLPSLGEVPWRPSQVAQIGGTVLALEEPVGDALARLESAADEPVAEKDVPAPVVRPTDATDTQAPTPDGAEGPAAGDAPVAPIQRSTQAELDRRRARRSWTAADMLVFVFAAGVLVACLAGLVWILRGG
jgi:pSer/pThr/pTyr-binding forkhead associated (FHA) protein